MVCSNPLDPRHFVQICSFEKLASFQLSKKWRNTTNDHHQWDLPPAFKIEHMNRDTS